VVVLCGADRVSPFLGAAPNSDDAGLRTCVCAYAGRDAAKEFAAERIQGAQFWDIDGVCDPSSDLPHMLPTEAAFAAAADALGISNDDSVVVYDGMGMFAAPRAWWTWRVFGHDRWVVRVTPLVVVMCQGGGGGGVYTWVLSVEKTKPNH